MVDQNKRDTLKIIAATTGAIAVGSIAAPLTAIAKTSRHGGTSDSLSKAHHTNLRPHFIVSAHFTNKPHGIEVQILNPTNTTHHIELITPAYTQTDQGTFNFSDCLEQYGHCLQARKSMVVPLENRTVSSALQLPSELPERLLMLDRIEAALRCSMMIKFADQNYTPVAVPRREHSVLPA